MRGRGRVRGALGLFWDFWGSLLAWQGLGVCHEWVIYFFLALGV